MITASRSLLHTGILLLSVTILFLIGQESWLQRTPHALVNCDASVNELNLESIPSNISSLTPREDYTCGPGRPCSNGACCGASGYCGYGSKYCGHGCVSNCHAAAECGKDAIPSGKKCPLNTCCSQYGFCGTTSDFCTKNCQSNCNLHPRPPSGSAKNQALKKVIGYYQSWSDRLACHQMAPSDLPLSELTHLNYAFAYIDPKSYNLVTMDSKTPERLFQLTVDTKQYNPHLKVFVSVGGWTFSDNDTVTQPLFGKIASTASNRQRFADNVVRFLNHYGFDGIDIDWEYPGAPDRGGKKEDTNNYVLLLRTLRSTFDGSPRTLGITFTVPSSYWYLRWFDLPGMMKYADWTNLMSYDLHGTWDQYNPIGSIVQGHTNLTEIKLAAELLWRVGVKPEQVALGFGFYGRSFELADPKCSKPGCPFRGGGRAGSCSATSGILMHYEIQAILDQKPGLKPIHDEQAAVNYLVFDKNQWVSYDDETTFNQKLKWAHEIGIGGSLIWASDTDDDKYRAMSGFVRRKVFHPGVIEAAFALTPIGVAQNLVGQNGQDCQRMNTCVDPDVVRCPSGWKKVGWDKAGCKSGGQLICCPVATTPSSCTWRGGGKDCNGQCHPGEVTLFGSSWGGGFQAESSTSKCTRGYKVFCCDAGDWKDVVKGCRWTNCGGGCVLPEREIVSSHNGCNIFHPSRKYCCPSNAPLYDCSWRGTPLDCPDAKCEADEVAIANDGQGDSAWGCFWGRKRTACCKVRKPPSLSMKCKLTSCDLDPGICQIAGEGGFGSSKRDEQSSVHKFEKRGGGRRFDWLALGGPVLSHISRSHIGPPQYMRYLQRGLGNLLDRWFRMRSQECGNPRFGQVSLRGLERPPAMAQVEHPIALMIAARYAQTANTGRFPEPIYAQLSETLPTGPRTETPAISTRFFTEVFVNPHGLPAGLPPVTPGSPELRRPVDRLLEALGSTTNPSPFVLLQDSVNAVKGRLEQFKNPMAVSKFNKAVRQAVRDGAGSELAVEEFMSPLRETVALFQYLRDPDMVTRQDETATLFYRNARIIEEETQGGTGLADHWTAFYIHYFSLVSQFAREYVTQRIQYTRQAFSGSSTPYREYVLAELDKIENEIPNMKYPFED